jgi:2-hydroxychromene-2-carboxylate isomerase
MPEFFKRRNFFTYFWWKMIDMKLKARKLGMKFVLPPRPDPIKQDVFTGKISPDQPYIFGICHLLQAAEKGKQLDFALEISSLIFGGGKDWNKDEELVEAASNIGLDFHEIKKRATANENQIIEEIKANQKDQLNAGHHGVPLSVYKNNYFFGQDRFNDLVEELKKDGLNYP